MAGGVSACGVSDTDAANKWSCVTMQHGGPLSCDPSGSASSDTLRVTASAEQLSIASVPPSPAAPRTANGPESAGAVLDALKQAPPAATRRHPPQRAATRQRRPPAHGATHVAPRKRARGSAEEARRPRDSAVSRDKQEGSKRAASAHGRPSSAGGDAPRGAHVDGSELVEASTAAQVPDHRHRLPGATRARVHHVELRRAIVDTQRFAPPAQGPVFTRVRLLRIDYFIDRSRRSSHVFTTDYSQKARVHLVHLGEAARLERAHVLHERV